MKMSDRDRTAVKHKATRFYKLQHTVEHAVNCPNNAFSTIQHNELHDFTAFLLSKVCHNVSVEHQLQPLTRFFPLALANRWCTFGCCCKLTFGGVAIRC